MSSYRSVRSTPMITRSMTFACAVAFFTGLAAAAAEPQVPGGKEFTNSIGMKLVRIEPGEFLMGAGRCAAEEPQGVGITGLGRIAGPQGEDHASRSTAAPAR